MGIFSKDKPITVQAAEIRKHLEDNDSTVTSRHGDNIVFKTTCEGLFINTAYISKAPVSVDNPLSEVAKMHLAAHQGAHKDELYIQRYGRPYHEGQDGSND